MNILPAKHHDRRLRISPRGVEERRGIHNPEPPNAEDPVLGIHHLAHVAATVVVPDGDDSVLAELLERCGVVGVPWYEVDVGLDAHVAELLHRVVLELRVVGEGLRLHELLHDAEARHAPG